MILEVAVLNVKPGMNQQFRQAFASAREIIGSMQGYRGHQLRECVETPNRFLLLVHWESLEEHTVRFRQSPQYRRWSALLHPFYDPFPVVEHYRAPL